MRYAALVLTDEMSLAETRRTSDPSFWNALNRVLTGYFTRRPFIEWQ
jgi:hypothetical protein